METPLNQAIGRKLRELREAHGIRKERIALELEMSAQNWALYEAGKQKLTVTMLPTIAQVYGMSLPDLVSALFENDAQGVVTGEQERSPKHSDEYGNNLALYLDKPRLHGIRSAPARSRELAAAGAR